MTYSAYFSKIRKAPPVFVFRLCRNPAYKNDTNIPHFRKKDLQAKNKVTSAEDDTFLSVIQKIITKIIAFILGILWKGYYESTGYFQVI